MACLIDAKIAHLTGIRALHVKAWLALKKERDALPIYRFFDRKTLNDQMLIRQGHIDGQQEAIDILKNKTIR